MIDSVVATRGLVFFDANARLRPTRGSVKKFSASLAPSRGQRGSTSRFPIQGEEEGRRRRAGGGGADELVEEDGGGAFGGGEGSPAGEGDKFEAWKRRAEAIVEPREAQQDSRNEESRMGELACRRQRPRHHGMMGMAELGILGRSLCWIPVKEVLLNQ
ncbi:hypothetical protein NL676_015958 [Syzygium grande]|nr:hypothetical protein NL676_015958 [Syzygium grande]